MLTARSMAKLLTGVVWSAGLACLPFVGGSAQAVDWQTEDGWLTAYEKGKALLVPGADPALRVTVDDTDIIPLCTVVRAEKPDSAALSVRYDLDTGLVHDVYEPFPEMGPDAWLRTVTYTNTSDAAQDLTGITMRVLPVCPEGGATWYPPNFAMCAGPDGRVACVSYRGAGDHYTIAVEETGAIAHQVQACWRLEPGAKATAGAQGIWLAQGEEAAFRQEAARWYGAIALTVPARPDWLDGAILYEVNAGGHMDSRFSDGGGFERLARQIPYLADLGISAVWLQGVHQHKTPPDPMKGGWNLYDPLDFSRVDPILGGPEALAALLNAFKGHGIRVIGELVPHGGHSKQAEALEAWWSQERDGPYRRNWGCYGMDYASPPWQAEMRDAAAMLSERFGMVGARIDVADGMGPNWGSPRTNHASYSGLGGAVEMLEAIREGLAQGTNTPVLVPEAFNTVEFFRLTPVGYGHQFWFLMGRELPQFVSQPRQMQTELRRFVENRRGNLPPGSRELRTLNNHDTIVESGRPQLRYGAGLARALYGVCLVTPGIPMMYQEEETGSFFAFRAMNWARRRIPEFSTGDTGMQWLDFHPAVYAMVRGSGQTVAVGLSNLSGEHTQGFVRLPGREGSWAHDAVSGERTLLQTDGFEWRLEPYATALIRVGQPPLDGPPPLAFKGESPTFDTESVALTLSEGVQAPRIRMGRLVVEVRAGSGPWQRTAAGRWRSPYGEIACLLGGGQGRLSVELGPEAAGHTPELLIYNAAEWWVSGRTALLGGLVLRRKFRFPEDASYHWDRSMTWGHAPNGHPYNHVAPTGRLWESLMEPLHPEKPAIAFTDHDGRTLVLDKVDTSARHLVLTDRTDEATAEPYGLALRFYASDPDLAPTPAFFGLGSGWRMDERPEQPAQAQKATLSFRELARGRAGVAEALAVKRLPVMPRRPLVKREGEFHTWADALWYVTPGTAVWENLPAVPGRYRVRLELRHSERGPDGRDQTGAYTVSVNGQTQDLEWVAWDTYHTGNAYFGHALTPPVGLSNGPHTIGITTSQPWCAVRGSFALVEANSENRDAADAY